MIVKNLIFIVCMVIVLAAAFPACAAKANISRTGVYSAEGRAIVGRNLKRYHNRALYCGNIAAVVLAGDLPHIRFAHEPYVCGSLMIAIDRGGKGKWLQDFSEVESRYHDAHMTWLMSDASLPGLKLTLDVVPMADAPGFCARLAVKGAKPGDRLIWTYGGATKRPPGGSGGAIAAALDPMIIPSLMTRGFVPEDCRGNVVSIDNGAFMVSPPQDEPQRMIAGRCSADSTLTISDAGAWQDPIALAANAKAAELPITVGIVPLTETEVFWAVESFDGDKTNVHIDNPVGSFQAGMGRAEAVGRQVVVDTPDERFDASVSAACAAIEGLFRPPQIMHGGLSWNMPYMGWRTMYGPTALGWHDIVKQAAVMYISTQEKADTKKTPISDPALGYTAETMDSRFYGLGHLNHPDQWRYDMQSMLFDMAIHAWRWTADPELEKALRDGLDLHLQWMKDCFDPDGDGLYESYQNVGEVDQVWYNGGGTAEETAYAYTGHMAAIDLARRAGDSQAVIYHKQQAEKIRKSLMRLLWIPDKGYVGAYREQIGLKRLHEDSWLYSIFMPIDAKMLTNAQSVQALHYTEWGLQRDKMPLGGERCWTSNWVPTTWSSRMRWTAHAYSLGLAYCQAGLPDEAWEVMKGGFLESSFNGIVPGGFEGEGVGMDFHETSCTFARAVVEGMFGYRPDCPNGVVRCSPSFPSKWDHASIKTPDFSLSFKRETGVDNYSLEMTNAAKIEFSVPVKARKVVSVEVDGKSVAWKSVPGYGHSIISVELPKRKTARFSVKWTGALPQHEPIVMEAVAGKPISLKAKQGKIVEITDPQQILSKEKIVAGVVNAELTRNAGHHLVLALVDDGKLKQWQIFKLNVSDPQAEAEAAAKLVKVIPKNTKWTCMDMKDCLNGDVRTIYKQEYLSPRPKTCSVRLGSNGYSSWPFYFWGVKVPNIDFSNVDKMLDSGGHLMTPQGVPFNLQSGERNIAFTSQWDNWPRTVTIPVGLKGKAVWLLVCGSTNQMQGKIANAEVRLKYSDGVVEKLEIIPPFNFWSLCGLPDGKDYDLKRDAFVLGNKLTATVQLGNNCRAILLNRRLRPNATLESVTLEALSQEVVIGLMGVTVMQSAEPEEQNKLQSHSSAEKETETVPNVLGIHPVTDLPHQTIGFELPGLPGNEFILVVPELVSDAERALLPWSQPKPKWDIGKDSARCLIEIEGTIRMRAEVLFQAEEIRVIVDITNLSDQVWRDVNLFTCFAFYRAPMFNDPGLRRTFVPIGNHQWKSLADLFAEHDPGDGPHTFFPVRGGPKLADLWIGRAIKQHHPQMVSRGAMCVVSENGKWIAGMTSSKPAYVFNNRREHCIHADPLLGTIKPGETAQAVSTLYIFQGSVEDFEKRMSNKSAR